MPQIINLENNVTVNPGGGLVYVRMRSGQPVRPEADLAVRYRSGALKQIAQPAVIDRWYELGTAQELINNAANVCWGDIFTPGPGNLFSLYCEFRQDGNIIGTSKKVHGVTTEAVVTFSTNSLFV